MKLKNLSVRICSIVLFTVLMLSSCTKDPTPAENLVGTWTAGTPTFTAMVGDKTLTQYFIDVLGLTATEAQQFTTLFNQSIQQSFTGTIQFKSDGTYTANLGGSADSGTWTLSADGKKLTIDPSNDLPGTFDVVELTSSKLRFSITQSDSEDLDDDGTPETITISVDLTFTK
jgi:hypothetical protein